MPSMDDKSTIYSKACDAFSRKDYEEALELFTELNGWLDSKEKAQACQIRIANPDYDNIIRQQQEKSMQFSQSVEKHHIKINKKLLAYIGAGIAGCVLLSIIIIAATSLLKKPVNVMSTSTEVSSNNNVQDRQDETDTNTNTNTDTYVPEQLQTQNSNIVTPQDAKIRLSDNAKLLSSEEASSLKGLLDTFSLELQLDLVIVTENTIGGSSVQSYADNFYDDNNYGFNESNDGVLLFIVMDTRDWYISTCGEAIRILTNERLDTLAKQFVPYLSSGEYYQGFKAFAQGCEELVAKNR